MHWGSFVAVQCEMGTMRTSGTQGHDFLTSTNHKLLAFYIHMFQFESLKHLISILTITLQAINGKENTCPSYGCIMDGSDHKYGFWIIFSRIMIPKTLPISIQQVFESNIMIQSWNLVFYGVLQNLKIGRIERDQEDFRKKIGYHFRNSKVYFGMSR